MRLIFCRKTFTKWDQTDNIKRMKDSDILAEKERSAYNLGDAASSAVTGALVGGTLAAGLGGTINTGRVITKGITKPGVLAEAGKSVMRYGKRGAMIGGAVGLGHYFLKNKDKAEENRFYNRRLRYAKEQAERREARDWRTNNTQRDGYSY